MPILLLLAAVVVALAIGYAIGRARRNGPATSARLPDERAGPSPEAAAALPQALPQIPLAPPPATNEAAIVHLTALAEERRRLFDDLAAARSETARYRQLVIDLENNAAPPLFGTGAPDDLKLIVGIGPVLERMLHQLGVASYRQIARWSEREIDEFDAKLPEFPGRIRRDAWVTQARALHQSKYGETLPERERR